MTPDRFEGCLLGLALGDALGAPHEGGAAGRTLWRVIGRTRRGEMRWTDDTQMALDLAESLADRRKLDADDVARRFAASYRWSRGYGPGTAKLLKRIRQGASWRQASHAVYPEGSFGNGGAMRAPVIGLFHSRQVDDLPEAARQSARVTHAHPLGMEGAVLIAAATALALASNDPLEIVGNCAKHCALPPFQTRLSIATNWLHANKEPPVKDVATQLGNGMTASESCVTALYIAMRFRNQMFQEMQTFVAACGGDVDTIGAMSGALWGAMRGAAALPRKPLEKLEQRERLTAAAVALHEYRL